MFCGDENKDASLSTQIPDSELEPPPFLIIVIDDFYNLSDIRVSLKCQLETDRNQRKYNSKFILKLKFQFTSPAPTPIRIGSVRMSLANCSTFFLKVAENNNAENVNKVP